MGGFGGLLPSRSVNNVFINSVSVWEYYKKRNNTHFEALLSSSIISETNFSCDTTIIVPCENMILVISHPGGETIPLVTTCHATQCKPSSRPSHRLFTLKGAEYSWKIWVGVCHLLLEVLTLFQTNRSDTPYPILDQTKWFSLEKGFKFPMLIELLVSRDQ